jgi:hypothetical protein
MNFRDKYESVRKEGNKIILVRRKHKQFTFKGSPQVVIDMTPPEVKGDPQLNALVKKNMKSVTQNLVNILTAEIVEPDRRNANNPTIQIYPPDAKPR